MKNCSTGLFGRLFLNAVTLESCSPGSVVCKKRNTTDPGTLRAAKHSRMTLCDERRGGFTLIELLVVVLIIGILSAIALPQYTKAVARSRMAGLITLASSVAQAEQRYFMANGEFTVNAEELDLSLPAGFSKTRNDPEITNYSDGTTRIVFYKDGEGGGPRVSVHHTKVPSFVLWGFDPDGSEGKRCGVEKDSSQKELGVSICATYGEFWTENSKYIYYHIN